MQGSGPVIRLGDAIKRRLSSWRWCFPASPEATPAGQVMRMPCRHWRNSELDLECDPNPSAQVPKSASASRKTDPSNQHIEQGEDGGSRQSARRAARTRPFYVNLQRRGYGELLAMLSDRDIERHISPSRNHSLARRYTSIPAQRNGSSKLGNCI
jgi:hypothetical protein